MKKVLWLYVVTNVSNYFHQFPHKVVFCTSETKSHALSVKNKVLSLSLETFPFYWLSQEIIIMRFFMMPFVSLLLCFFTSIYILFFFFYMSLNAELFPRWILASEKRRAEKMFTASRLTARKIIFPAPVRIKETTKNWKRERVKQRI